LLHGEDELRERIAAKLIPPAVTHEFEKIQRATADSLNELTAALQSFDPTLAASAIKSRAKILYQLSKLQGKTARETLNRDRRASDDARYMSGLIFPEKHLQERFYSILPFAAQHGLGLMDTLYANIRLDCPDHTILVVN
jgi:hypothetical protein